MSHSSGSSSEALSTSGKNRKRLDSWETISNTSSPESNLKDALLSYADRKHHLRSASKAEGREKLPAQLRAFVENVMQKLHLLPPNKYHATCKKIDELLYAELMTMDLKVEGSVQTQTESKATDANMSCD